MDWINKLHNIENKIKQQLFAKRLDNLNSYYQLLQEYVASNTNTLPKDVFVQFLAKLGIFLTTQELRAIYEIYQSEEDGDQVKFKNFFQDIKYNFSEKRKEAIRNAFLFLTKGEQTVSLEKLLKNYITIDHPRVLTKEKTQDQVVQEFFSAISKKRYEFMNDSADGFNITEQEFFKYYADLNMVLPNEKEDYFENLVIKTWGLTNSSDYVSPLRIQQLENIFYEKVRQRTLTKQNEGKTLGSTFKYYDIEREGSSDLESFVNVLKYYGCVFNKHEIKALFNKYDTQQEGIIQYEKISTAFQKLGRKVN